MARPQIDAMSNATPRTGTRTYIWDGTDSRGELVPNGNYILFVEGTLRWENQVLYRAPFTIGQGSTTVQVNVEYTGNSTEERSMIGNVRVRTLR